jgi:hypothetical protein
MGKGGGEGESGDKLGEELFGGGTVPTVGNVIKHHLFYREVFKDRDSDL